VFGPNYPFFPTQAIKGAIHHVPVKIVHKALRQITYAQRANIDIEADPSTRLTCLLQF